MAAGIGASDDNGRPIRWEASAVGGREASEAGVGNGKAVAAYNRRRMTHVTAGRPMRLVAAEAVMVDDNRWSSRRWHETMRGSWWWPTALSMKELAGCRRNHGRV